MKLKYRIFNAIEDARYWVRTHTIHRYHLIDIRSPKNGYAWGWVESSEAILYACFALLVRFVEKEHPNIGLVRTPEEYWPNYGWPSGEEEKKGIAQQVAIDVEIRALYDWWTKERPKMVDRGRLWAGHPDHYHALRAADEEMLGRLMKVRDYLWA